MDFELVFLRPAWAHCGRSSEGPVAGEPEAGCQVNDPRRRLMILEAKELEPIRDLEHCPDEFELAASPGAARGVQRARLGLASL